MKKETESQLETLMDKYDQRLAQAKEQRERAESRAKAFLNEFKRLREEIIHPVMEDVGNKLKERGHDYRIYEEEESLDANGRKQNAKITMEIYPAGKKRAYTSLDTSHISFIAQGAGKVLVHDYVCMPTGGGSGGPRGEIDINQINSDIVEGEILKVLQGVFVSKW